MAQSGLNRNASLDDGDKIKAGIIFDKGLNSDNIPPGHIVSYKIRLVDVFELENTKDLFPWFQMPGPNLG